MIPFFGLDRQYANLKEELVEASHNVLATGQVLDGPHTMQFEAKIAAKCHRKYAVSVNSCTQALVFAQQALNVRGNVLIPTTSFVATLNSVLLANNNPRYGEIDITGLLEVKEYTDVDAIMHVNLFGNMIDYASLKAKNPNAKIIEDAAQSFGATFDGIPSGKMGDISVLSFDPTKNLPNYGSGGMLLTDDCNVYQTLLDLRDNGKTQAHMNAGTNSKMSEVDCAHMSIKLKYFSAWQARRKDIAAYYANNITADVITLLPDSKVDHAWHKYVVRTIHRDALRMYLQQCGVETKVHYNKALYDHAVSPYKHVGFTVTEMHKATSLSLPIFPEMTDSEVESVVLAVNSFSH